MQINKVGVLYHPMNQAAGALARELDGFLKEKGVASWLCSAWEGEQIKACVDGTDLFLTVGGDGTILRAAQGAAPGVTAVVGINMGKLGFMTELSAAEAKEKIALMLAGEGWIDERAMLEARLGDREYHALNDVVVARGLAARTISVAVQVNGEKLADYRADGVVAATATGSTGYSLAAGGPILHPQAGEFVVVPLLPHLSLANPIVLPAGGIVEFIITIAQDATLCVDGHINQPLASGDRITVRQSKHKTRFLRLYKENFYGTLGKRLKGKR